MRHLRGRRPFDTYYVRITFAALAFFSMTPKQVTSIRLSPGQLRKLEKLSKKLDISKANVLRLAITRLAEAEGIR